MKNHQNSIVELVFFKNKLVELSKEAKQKGIRFYFDGDTEIKRKESEPIEPEQFAEIASWMVIKTSICFFVQVIGAVDSKTLDMSDNELVGCTSKLLSAIYDSQISNFSKTNSADATYNIDSLVVEIANKTPNNELAKWISYNFKMNITPYHNVIGRLL